MDQERQEVYERIPWETLEKKGGDRQWLVLAVAAAVAVGALAYSFMQNRPSASPVASELVAPIVQPVAPVSTFAAATTAPTSPMVVAEADLYAIDQAELESHVAAHAEWFAVEYFTSDRSDQSPLDHLMPVGIPLPTVPEGTQVFVDWVGTRGVSEVAPLVYEVEVMVRSLVAQGEEPFVRQAPRLATVTVVVGDDGQPRVSHPPQVVTITPPMQATANLAALPSDLQAQLETTHGQVVGGEQLPDGRWRAVVMVTGPDGVSRPQTVIAP